MIDDAAGHRALPHTADVQVEAWAPTREACIAEAVRGVVACFVDTAGMVGERAYRFSVDHPDDSEILVEVLDEVIYQLDTTGQVPADVRVSTTATGVQVELAMAVMRDEDAVGAAPKGVSRHELRLDRTGQGWRCLVTIDV